MTVRVGVIGTAGRMGVRIANIVETTDGVILSGGVEAPGSPFVGMDIGDAVGLPSKGIAISGSLADCIDRCDVIIDFSVPSVSLANFLLAHETGKSIVIGTTGFRSEHWESFESMSKTCRAVIAPNMSVGVNALFKMAYETAKILGDDYDVEIVEMHHNLKVDAPSGTAARLAEVTANALGRDISKVANYGRHGQVGVRPKKEIGVMTLRGGDVVGEHTVIFAGQGERVELTHKAASRDNFAKGAIRAAAWIVDQPHGLYDMQDVLGLS